MLQRLNRLHQFRWDRRVGFHHGQCFAGASFPIGNDVADIHVLPAEQGGNARQNSLAIGMGYDQGRQLARALHLKSVDAADDDRPTPDGSARHLRMPAVLAG
ncbi:hypothetical protein D3C74_345240 [compost metagenome]